MKEATRLLSILTLTLLPWCLLVTPSPGTAASNEELWVNLFPVGLRTYGLWVDVQNDDTLYAATRYGLYQTDSGGRHWSPLLQLYADWLTLAQSQSHPGTMFLGTSTRGDGSLLKSQDRGRTWEAVQSTMITKAVAEIWIHPGSPQTVVVLSGGSILKTLNGGNTWGDITPAVAVGDDRVSPPIRWFTVDPSDSAHIIAVGTRTVTDLMRMISNLMESFDGGVTWQPKDFVVGGTQNSRHQSEDVSGNDWSYLAFPSNDPTLLVGMLRTGAAAPLLISQDGGSTWMGSALGGIEAVDTLPGARALYVGGDAGVSFTRDGGMTWQKVLPEHTSSLALTATKGFYAATYEGMLKSLDSGQHWKRAGLGLPVELFRNVGLGGVRESFENHRKGGAPGVGLFGCAYENGRILVGSQGAYWETPDSGLSWERREIGNEGNIRQIECTQDGTLYLSIVEQLLPGGVSSIVKVSKEGALQKVRVDKSPRLIASSFDHPEILLLSVREDETYLGPEYGKVLLKSEDGGFSWKGIDLRPWIRKEASRAEIVGISTVVMAERDPKVAYAALQLLEWPSVTKRVALLITEDGGQSWRDVMPAIAAALGPRDARDVFLVIRALTLADSDGKTAYVATSNRVVRSTDTGRSWSTVPTSGIASLKKEEIRGVACTRGDETGLYVATEQQVFRSRDGGRSWVRIQSKLSDPYVDQLVARGDLVILQGVTGIYRLSESDLSWAREAEPK